MKIPQLPPNNLVEAHFLHFLHANNIAPIEPFSVLIDSNIHRFKLHGDKQGETSGAYCIYSEGWPAGWAMDWHFGHSINWHYSSDNPKKEEVDYLSSPEFKIHVAEAKKIWEAQLIHSQDEAADNARSRIETLPNAPENHPYLQKKNVFPYGVKLEGNNLAIPLHNIDGQIRSLQRISPDGEKRLFPGAAVKGCFWSIGLDTIQQDNNNPVILLGEGFATMAKVYELTGFPSVAGISCHNLISVAQALKGKFPHARIIITADNDVATQDNTGVNPGIKAALDTVHSGNAVAFIVPDFNDNQSGSDWDDFSILNGDDFTADILIRKIHEALIPPEVKAVLSRTTCINAQVLRSKVFPPVKWAVPGFLPEGLSILAGGPKVGKSILALHISVGVAIGGCVLGKIDVQKGNVLYLALEDTQRRIQERINSGELAGDDSIDLSSLDIITEIPRQNIGGTVYLEWWLSNHSNARLVIIDTLQMFRKLLTGKGSMYSEDYEAISSIKKIADNFHVPILILHHLKKGMEGDWLSEISGSQGIAGAADTIFSLKRERNSTLATLHRTGRDVEEKDFIMKLDGFGWTLQDEVEAFTMPEWKRQILDFLKDNPSVTPIQLSNAYGLDTKTAQKNLYRLVKENVIRKTGYGTYGLPEE